MQISIVGGPFAPFPPGLGGAVERVWHGLAMEFARQNYETTTVSKNFSKGTDVSKGNSLTEIRIPGPRRRNSRFLDILFDLQYSLRAVRFLPKSDILVTNSFCLPIIARYSRKNLGKLCIHVQRMPKGQMWLYKGAHRFQAVSQAIADELILQRPADKELVRIFPNPIDTSFFKPRSFGSRKSDVLEVLYAGRIHPEKGLETLIDAFHLLEKRLGVKKFRLTLIGPWRLDQGGAGEHYLRSLKSRAVSGNICFQEPAFDRAKFAQILGNASVFCYPSIAETGEASPVAPVEAMATGLAPIVSALPQFKDTVKDNITGIVFDHRATNPAEVLCDALCRMLSSEDLRNQLGAAAASAASHLSYENVAKIYLQDFTRLLGKDHGSAKIS